ncbi:hypothetical protein ACYBSK_06465 [Streptomyces sp. BYX5S]
MRAAAPRSRGGYGAQPCASFRCADKAGGPHADRKALGVAAGMPRSRLYRILEKYGRPANRRTSEGN